MAPHREHCKAMRLLCQVPTRGRGDRLDRPISNLMVGKETSTTIQNISRLNPSPAKTDELRFHQPHCPPAVDHPARWMHSHRFIHGSETLTLLHAWPRPSE